MTQQNETAQDAASQPVSSQPVPSQPVSPQAAFAPAGLSPERPGVEPAFPSPYLEPGQTVPHAYPAPAQPGLPGFGASAARAYRAGQGQRMQPPAGRRDATVAPAWQRLVASALDWLIIGVISVIAFWHELEQVWRQWQAVALQYQDLSSPGAQAAIDSMLRNQANQHALLFWTLGLFGLALVYFWVQHAAWGATLGKRALGMRVVRAADRARIGVLTAGIRTVVFLIGPAVFLIMASPFNVLGGVLWAADGGLGLLDRRAQALHDKLAGTVVIRRGEPQR